MPTEHATVSKSRKISGIWFIPLLALVLGAYVVIHNWMTQGPSIEIAFKTADGLEEGKTKIKYRNVEMGLVNEVRLNDQLNGVIAKVKMEPQSAPLLLKDTGFWVVTARVGLGNITGLDTLLTGAYIELAPGSDKTEARTFVGLDRPPLTPADAPGLRLKMTSNHASSVSAGDTVLYKGYKVGRVETMTFDPKDKLVHYQIFIDDPYHELVNSNVRFWDISGVSVSTGASGFKVQTGSIETILFGGVTFGVPLGVKEGDPVAKNSTFKLYKSYKAVLENPFRYGTYYVVSFTHTVKGLSPGAPVEFRGIKVGNVVRILFKEGQAEQIDAGHEGEGAPIPVLVYVEPGRMELSDTKASLTIVEETIRLGVGNGLRASMERGNLLTGAQYINIDYYPAAEEADLGTFMQYTTIPTIETGLAQLEEKVTSILDTINALPLADTVATLNQNLVSLQSILDNQSTQELPTHLDQTVQELRAVIGSLSPNSDAAQTLDSSLLSLNRTLANLESLTGTLSRQPSAVIFPSSPEVDPIPEVTAQ